MKVKQLITELLSMPMDAEVSIDIDDDVNSENYHSITYVLAREGVSGKFVVINSEWGIPKEKR